MLVVTAVAGHDGHRGWIYYLAVRAGGRGRGHVAAMMRACEQWLHERAVPKLNVMVRDDNVVVRGSYARLGYVIDDVTVLSRRLD